MTASETEIEGISGLEGDEEGSRIVAEELRLLGIVKTALQTRVARQSTAEGQRRDDAARLLELRDDVAIAKPEDLPALFEQMHHLGALQAQRGRGAQGLVDARAPYFAHLRLVENGKRRDVLIGARSYVDPGAGIRIVDWRHAPVSKIYYRYQEGEEYEEELGDRLVEGTVAARRNVAIAAGELIRVASPQGVFLQRGGRWSRMATHAGKLAVRRTDERPRLGVGADQKPRTDKHLPAIAAMLDAAQFELITRPGTGLVAIQGSAGSGKTTVGLHRAAYLASADPRRFRPERMLVIVPNEALRHYVGRVLPSLGVEGVAIGTFARFARRIVPDLFPRLPYAVADATPPVVTRAKTHAAMHHAMKAMQERTTRAFDSRVRSTISKWPNAGTAASAWDATADLTIPDARLGAFAQWLSGKRKLGTGLASELPDVTRSALDKVIADHRVGPRAVIAAWDELCTSRERLGRTFENAEGFGAGQLDQVHAWCVRQLRVRSEGERDGETPTLDVEDHAMLLRLWQLLRGPLLTHDGAALRFAHVFIDEVQDASPIELAVLIDLAELHGGRTAGERSVTLAGDAAQRLSDEGQDRGELDWNALLEELGVPHTTLEPLKVSYRSTAEITSFARAVLGPYAHDSEPIATRHGPPVEMFEFTSPGEAVAFLADALRTLAREAPDANVALLARFAQQADVYYEGLARAEVPNVRRVAKQDFTWEPGFDVTDVRQTKGLEFDEVILVDTNAASYPNTAPARHSLYVGATRAAHQLWCTTSDAPSPLVQTALIPPVSDQTS
jgi:DNA helicase-2/ATP-dependent DNA helicase PcrA